MFSVECLANKLQQGNLFSHFRALGHSGNIRSLPLIGFDFFLTENYIDEKNAERFTEIPRSRYLNGRR